MVGTNFPKLGIKSLKYDKHLVGVYLLYFLFYCATSGLWPYFQLVYKNLGLNVDDSALVSTVLPLINIPSNILSGMLADKIGSYKPIFLITTILATLFYNFILLIPQMEKFKTPEKFIFSYHSNQAFLEPNCSSTFTTFCPISDTLHNVVTTVNDCIFSCHEMLKPIANLCNATICEEMDLPFISDNFSVPLSMVLHPNTSTCTYTVSLANSSTFGTTTDLGNCTLMCQAKSTSSEFENICYREGSSHRHVFWIYFGIVVLASVFISISMMLLDSIAFAILKLHSGDYGRLKGVALLGRIILTPITGIIVDYINKVVGRETIFVYFIVWDVAIVGVCITACIIKMIPEKRQKNLMKNMKHVIMKRADVIFVLITTLFLGALWGFFLVFLIWHLAFMGASTLNIGMVRSVASIFALPFYYMSDTIIAKVGRHNLIFISFVAYFARSLIYVYLTNPWWAVIIEGFANLLTYNILWVALPIYANAVGGSKLRVTMIGFFRIVHFYLGRSIGVFIGGIFVKSLGMRNAFLVVAAVSLAGGFIYRILQCAWIGKIEQKMEELNKLEDEEEKLKLTQQEAEEKEKLNKEETKPALSVDVTAATNNHAEVVTTPS